MRLEIQLGANVARARRPREGFGVDRGLVSVQVQPDLLDEHFDADREPLKVQMDARRVGSGVGNGAGQPAVQSQLVPVSTAAVLVEVKLFALGGEHHQFHAARLPDGICVLSPFSAG